MKHISALIVLLLAFGYIIAVQAQEPDHPGRYSLHKVQPGESLWSISEKYLPDIDPRTGIRWIMDANGLDDVLIHPGDILNVPDYDGPLTEPLGPWYSCPEAAEAAEREFQELLREKRPQPAARGATTRTMTVEATAYCPCRVCTGKGPEHPAYGITASGAPAAPGTVAVDPAAIPLGTRMWVEGYGEAVAADTGGMIKGRKIDVYFPTHQEAVEWGRKRVTIKIFQEVDRYE